MRARAFVLPSAAFAAILAVAGIAAAVSAQTTPPPMPHSPALITYRGHTFDPGNQQDVWELNGELKTQFPPCSDQPEPTFSGTSTIAVTICMTSRP